MPSARRDGCLWATSAEEGRRSKSSQDKLRRKASAFATDAGDGCAAGGETGDVGDGSGGDLGGSSCFGTEFCRLSFFGGSCFGADAGDAAAAAAASGVMAAALSSSRGLLPVIIPLMLCFAGTGLRLQVRGCWMRRGGGALSKLIARQPDSER